MKIGLWQVLEEKYPDDICSCFKTFGKNIAHAMCNEILFYITDDKIHCTKFIFLFVEALNGRLRQKLNIIVILGRLDIYTQNATM